MFRDQDSYRSQKSYHGKDEASDAHLPAVVEQPTQTELVPVELPKTAADQDLNTKPRRKSRRAFDRRTLIAAAAVIAIIAAGGAGAHWWVTGRYMVSTDDAYVGPTTRRLAPRLPATSPSFRSRTTPTSMPAIVIAPHRRRRLSPGRRRRPATRSRPSRRPSPASTARSRRSARPSRRRRRSSLSAQAGANADAARIRAPAGALAGQAIRQQADARTGDRQPRSGQCVGPEREGRAR